MDIQPIINKVIAASSEAWEVGKAAALWLGHTVSQIFTVYGVPALEKLASFSVTAFNQSRQFLRTQPGPVFGIAGGLLLLGVTAFKIADRKAYEDNMFARTTWKMAGMAAFVGAVAVTGAGIYASLT